MTLVPDFDLGLWNAWIIVGAWLIASFLPFFFGGDRAEERMSGEPSFKESGAGFRIGTTVTHGVLMPLALLYGLFVPLEIGTWWLYAGLVVSVLGIGMAAAASVSLVVAPLDAPITDGVFAISRHPMYVSFVLTCAGVGLAATSWVFLAGALAAALAWQAVVPEEEQIMIAKYGPAYVDYMQRTVRWLGMPKPKEPVSVA